VNAKNSYGTKHRGCIPPLVVLAAVGLVLAMTVSAQATSLGTVRLKYAGVSPRRASNITIDGSTTSGILTGKYNLQLDATYTPTGEGVDVYAAANAAGQIGTFCADVLQWAPTSYLVYDVYHPEEAPIGAGNSPIGIAKAWDLRRLFSQRTGDTGTHDGAAAFQAAVWEIVYEESGTYDVFSGDIALTYYWGSGWLDTANDWLDALGSDQPDVGLRVLANADKQDFAMWVPGLPAAAIPEPLTALGLLLGGAALTAYSRRRRSG